MWRRASRVHACSHHDSYESLLLVLFSLPSLFSSLLFHHKKAPQLRERKSEIEKERRDKYVWWFFLSFLSSRSFCHVTLHKIKCYIFSLFSRSTLHKSHSATAFSHGLLLYRQSHSALLCQFDKAKCVNTTLPLKSCYYSHTVCDKKPTCAVFFLCMMIFI